MFIFFVQINKCESTSTRRHKSLRGGGKGNRMAKGGGTGRQCSLQRQQAKTERVCKEGSLQKYMWWWHVILIEKYYRKFNVKSFTITFLLLPCLSVQIVCAKSAREAWVFKILQNSASSSHYWLKLIAPSVSLFAPHGYLFIYLHYTMLQTIQTIYLLQTWYLSLAALAVLV